MVRAAVILVGAGSGTRLEATTPKAFLPLGGRPILALAAEAAATAAPVERLVVAVPAGWEERGRAVLSDLGTPVTIVAGGASRQATVRAALAVTPDDVAAIVVHDVARPFASTGLFSAVLRALDAGEDGAVPVVPVADTVLRTHEDVVVAAEPRDELVLAQTPQAFAAGPLREAHAKAHAADRSFTDDASLLRWAGFRVRTVPGDPANVKITTPIDVTAAERRVTPP